MRATDSLIEQVVDLQEMLEDLGKNVELTTAKKKHKKNDTMYSENSNASSNTRSIAFTRSHLNQEGSGAGSGSETPTRPQKTPNQRMRDSQTSFNMDDPSLSAKEI